MGPPFRQGACVESNTQARQFGSQIAAMRPRQIGGLALFYPILEELRVQQVVHGLVPSAADVDLGRIITLLVLNRLMTPQPLYHVGEWFSDTVLPEVLGAPAAKVYDNRLGRALDRLYPYWGRGMGTGGQSCRAGVCP